jgi:hypothetical protein
VNIEMNELNSKVDQLSSRFEKIEEALLKVAQMQVELTQVVKANDKRDTTIEKIQDRLMALEKDVSANTQTLSWTERFFWIVVSAGVWLVGKNIL